MFSQLAAKEDQPRQFIAREGNGVDNPTESRDGVNDVSDAYTYMFSTSCDAATQFDAPGTESIADEREAPVSSADVEQFADLSEEDVTSFAVEAYACDPHLFYSMQRRLAIDDESFDCSEATYENDLRSFDICPTFTDAARPIVVPPMLDSRHANLYLGVKTRDEAESLLSESICFAMYHLWLYTEAFEGNDTLRLHAVLRLCEQDRASHLAICMSSEFTDAMYHVEGMKRYFPTLNDLVDFYCFPSEDCTDDMALLQLATAVSCFSASHSESERDLIEVRH